MSTVNFINDLGEKFTDAHVDALVESTLEEQGVNSIRGILTNPSTRTPEQVAAVAAAKAMYASWEQTGTMLQDYVNDNDIAPTTVVVRVSMSQRNYRVNNDLSVHPVARRDMVLVDTPHLDYTIEVPENEPVNFHMTAMDAEGWTQVSVDDDSWKDDCDGPVEVARLLNCHLYSALDEME